MLFGYDQGVMGSLLTGPSFEATFPSISNGNSTLQGFAVREDGAWLFGDITYQGRAFNMNRWRSMN